MTIRLANTVADAAIICHHRRSMFRDMGYTDDAALDAMIAAFRPWVEVRLQSGEYVAWLVQTATGEVIAGGGVWLMDWPPHMIGGPGPRANILNVYTEMEYRGQGLARQLMEAILQWLRENHVGTVILHASEQGRTLYEKLGFQATNEMRLLLQ